MKIFISLLLIIISILLFFTFKEVVNIYELLSDYYFEDDDEF